MKRLSLLLPLMLMMAGAAMAQGLDKITYQGTISDSTGPVNGNRTMTFKVYNAPTGGNALWTETRTVPVKKGAFNTVLGTTTSLSTLPAEGKFWLGVAIEGTEMERTELTTVAPPATDPTKFPPIINYQGTIAGGEAPVSGSKEMTFKIYKDSTGGKALWSETQTVNVVKGEIAAVFGKVNPLSVLPSNGRYWLGITVDDKEFPRGEMTMKMPETK